MFTIFHQIKDDAKNGLYVENVTEEYVTSYDDVTQILIKVGCGGWGVYVCDLLYFYSSSFVFNHCNSGFIYLTFSMYDCRDFRAEKSEQPL